MYSYRDDTCTLIKAALQDFSSQLYSEFPLRNFGEFYDEEQLKKKILQLKENVSKNFFSKVWDRDKEQVISLLMKLRARMTEEIIAHWMDKNEKHKINSVSYLQKRAEMLCEDFQMALEDQLLLNPDMEMDSLNNYVDCQKEYAVNYFDGFWNPKNNHLNVERRVKMAKALAAIGEEVLDKHKRFLEKKLVDEGKMLVEELKIILVEKSKQLKAYVDRHQGQVSRRYLKAEVEDMKEYLLNGKGSPLRESQKDIYYKVMETLEGGIKFLTEEGDAKSSEDFIEWVKELDLKLKSCCSNDGGIRDETRRIQLEGDACNTSEQRSGITMQKIMKDEPFRSWDREELDHETRMHEEGGDDNMTRNKSKDCEEGDERLSLVKKSKENDRPESASSAPKRTRLRRPRPTNSSVKSKSQTLKNSEGSLAGTHDSHLPKKQRTVSNLFGKAVTKSESSVYRQRSSGNDKTVVPDPANPPRRSSRLEKNSSEHDDDMMKETFGDQVHNTYEPSSSSSKDKEDQGTVATDKHKDSSTSRESDSGESSEIRCSNLTACPDQITIPGGDPPSFKCDVCKSVLTQKHSLNFQGKLCWNCWKALRQYKCDDCGKEFFRKADLVDHIRTHTKSEKPFICPTCAKRFTRNDNLLIHIRSHSGKLPLGCIYCDQRCLTNAHMMAHVITHSDERPFSCPTCNRSFCVKRQLVRHIQNVHRQPKENADKLANDSALEYLRDVTGNPNYNGDTSSTVVLSHAVKKANLRIPDEIDKTSSPEATTAKGSSSTNASVRLDRITILRRHPPTYKCDVCGNVIKRKCDLKNHGKNCSKNGHKCHHCDKQFSKMSTLVVHQRMHTGEKPFKCPMCDKQFTHRGNLHQHMRIHTHRQTEKRLFRCEKCWQSCKDRISLSRHMLKHEGKLPFGCSYCDQRYADMRLLKQHVIIHCDERPYRCVTCERTFSRKSHLSRHMQRCHHQSKEDATRLANEAAVDYMLRENPTSVDTYSYANIESVVLSHTIKKANLKLC